jgi:hypothetical protein
MRKIKEQFNLNSILTLLLTTCISIIGFLLSHGLSRIESDIAELRREYAQDHDAITSHTDQLKSIQNRLRQVTVKP